MRNRSLLLIPLAVPLLAVTCDPTFYSEQEDWAFVDWDLTVSGPKGFTNEDEAILAGTSVCPEVRYRGDEESVESDEFWECFQHTVDPGSVDPGAGCITLSDPGEVQWSFEASSCTDMDQGWEAAADRVVFQVVEPATVAARVQQWSDEFAIDHMSTNADRVLDDSLLNPAGEPFRVMAGEDVLLYLGLQDQQTGLSVAWHAPGGEVQVEALQGEVEVSSVDAAGFVQVRLAEGAEASVSLVMDQEQWTADSTLLGVSEGDVASLEILPVYGEVWWAYSHSEVPVAARAIVRDGEGNLVFGTPVRWSVVRGSLRVSPGPVVDVGTWFYLPGADYAFLEDSCQKPSRRVGPQEVVLRAEFGDLDERVTVSWDALDPDQLSEEDWEDLREEDEDFEPDPECMGSSCGCSGAPAGGTLWLWSVAGLGLGWRRRRTRCEQDRSQ